MTAPSHRQPPPRADEARAARLREALALCVLLADDPPAGIAATWAFPATLDGRHVDTHAITAALLGAAFPGTHAATRAALVTLGVLVEPSPN